MLFRLSVSQLLLRFFTSPFICVLMQLPMILGSLTAEECQKVGFTSHLLCSTCSEMPQYGLEKLIDECHKCCTDDQLESTITKYPLAQIEICECNLARFPQVQAFVKSDQVKRWGIHLRVRHVRGTLPTIKLMDEHAESQQTLNIEKWDTDTITDFLDTWLEY